MRIFPYRRKFLQSVFLCLTLSSVIKYSTIQYNTLLKTPRGGFSVTMQLREVTIVSKKTKINSKTLYYVYIKIN